MKPMNAVTTINPTFSVYKLIERVHRETTLIKHRQTMTYISNEIENTTILDGAQTVMFSGFQRMSKFCRQVKRYEKLARRAQAVYVFAHFDVEPPTLPDNVRFVALRPDDQLVKEWFLVSMGVDYASALATEELSHIDDPDHMRRFRGVWTFNHDMVAILHEWLLNEVGERTHTTLPQESSRKQLYYVSQIIARMQDREMRLAEAGQTFLAGELRQLLSEQLNQSLQELNRRALSR
jgi:hypothetical protein